MTTTAAGMEKIVSSPGGELLQQDSLGRVRTPLEKREAIVRAFEAAGMSAARWKVCSQSQVRLATALLRELEGAEC